MISSIDSEGAEGHIVLESCGIILFLTHVDDECYKVKDESCQRESLNPKKKK